MQGLSRNKEQFILLVLVNAFVGAMIGLERAILPGFGKEFFSIDANTVLLSFIIAFGITKSISNYLVGELSNVFTRKQILVLGWLFAIPVPLLLMYAQSWTWVIIANVFLGINQGLSWSATVIMKIDLVGQKNRGFAMGINEFAGYLSVGLASYLASTIVSSYGYSFYPFIPGILFAALGLLLTVFFIRDTTHFVAKEQATSNIPILDNLWKQTSWKHENIGTVTLNGVVNNMNDAVVWGLVPILLAQRNLTVEQIGIVAGLYPAVWGISQIFTGKMGDAYCKKQLIAAGMLIQSLAITLFVLSTSFIFMVIASIILGIGTALVYPNFLTIVAENTNPIQRAKSLSIFRFWRDSGYVIGALLAGSLATWFGIQASILSIAVLTAIAGLFANYRMCCTNKKIYPSKDCIYPSIY